VGDFDPADLKRNSAESPNCAAEILVKSCSYSVADHWKTAFRSKNDVIEKICIRREVCFYRPQGGLGSNIPTILHAYACSLNLMPAKRAEFMRSLTRRPTFLFMTLTVG
jgi:hypothetical protein